MKQKNELDLDQYFKVGWVKEPHGLKGEIYVKLLSQNPEWLEDIEQFVLSGSEGAQVYPIKKWRPHKQGLIILSEEIKNRNESEALKGHEFLISKKLLTTAEAEQPFLIELKGFEVVDSRLGLVGRIVAFADNGAQDLIEVEAEAGVVHLIPLVDPFIQEIDREGKIIRMDLPEGLLE